MEAQALMKNQNKLFASAGKADTMKIIKLCKYLKPIEGINYESDHVDS
jgi:hypothetical protein